MDLNILEINDFSLEEHKGAYVLWPSKSKLFKSGKYVGQKITGYYIERQFKFDEYYFFVVSYDCPFEEQCDFILLNTHFKQIAHRSLTPWFYSSWNLDSHQYLGNNQFLFTFNGDCDIAVKLNPKNKFFGWRRISINRIK